MRGRRVLLPNRNHYSRPCWEISCPIPPLLSPIISFLCPYHSFSLSPEKICLLLPRGTSSALIGSKDDVGVFLIKDSYSASCSIESSRRYLHDYDGPV